MNKSLVKNYLIYTAIGLLLGGALAKIGFADYDELYKMFTYTDLRMLYAFLLGTALAALLFYILKISTHFEFQKKLYHPGTLLGSAIFGAGWFFCGACPGIILVQLGQGKVVAFITLVGLVTGIWLYRLIHNRFFMWDSGSCGM